MRVKLSIVGQTKDNRTQRGKRDMPGGRLKSFRLGDRTELMAEFVLNTIAFTTRVPRQEDIGHDFLCALSELRNGFYWAGPSFTVQAKSDNKPLEFDKPHEIAWIKEQENPFFLAVGNCKALKLDIYSTWNRLNGFLAKAAEKVIFELSPPPPGQEPVATEQDCSKQVIYLGRPIVSASIQEMMDEAHAISVRDKLRRWILLDRENIVNSRAGMHWVVGPTEWQTNELITEDTPKMLRIFWNAKNLPRCERNFGRAATELRLTLRQALGEPAEQLRKNAEQVAALETVLRSYVQCIDPLSRSALERFVGMQFGAGGLTSAGS